MRRSLVNSISSASRSVSGSSHSVSLNCRMYSSSYPSINDLEMGAYCSLLEYNNIEGMILMSELSRRRIRSVNKIIRVGRQEIVAVLRVNQEKGKQHTFCLCFICVLCVCKKFLEISDFFSLCFVRQTRDIFYPKQQIILCALCIYTLYLYTQDTLIYQRKE